MAILKRGGLAAGQADTLIGKHSAFDGKLKATGSVRIEGSFRGELTGDANIVIGDSGRVEANMQGKNIILAGEVRGNITASGRTEITASGKLYGDLKTKSLVIDDGAVFQGACITEETTRVSSPKQDVA
jgi:cytoskeletal protein CcmA (bactofilin family)